MLLDGVNHVAILTNDTERLHDFYRSVFDATIGTEVEAGPGMRLSFVDIGIGRELNVFQIDGNAEAQRQVPRFGRGRSAPLRLQAASRYAFHTLRHRLMAC